MLFGVLSGAPVQAQSDPIANPPLTITVTDPRTNFPRNREITPIIPVTTGGGGNTFSISPSLPAGLVFDTLTGTISGTPTTQAGMRTYTLMVTDDQGATAQATVRFGVRSLLVNLSLSTNTSSLIVGESMDPVLSIVTEGNDNYTLSISPALPAGLTFDTATGTISGIPEQRLPSTEFRVRVTEGFYSTSQVLRIEINNPELTIAYMQQTLNLIRNVQMAAFLPAVNGGEPAYRYAISPALPEGLIFSEADGSITGAPTTTLTETAFAVTVTDGATETATTTFNLAVGQPAVGLILSSQTANLTLGEEMTPVTTSGSGGDGTYTFTIAPALPDGITIDTATGTISGTPSAARNESAYTVTLRDGAGATTTATITLSVDGGEIMVALSETAIILTGNEMMSMAVVSASGGDGNYRYAVSPALPAGLTLDGVSGILSGMASGQAGTRSYTVTVTDGNGASGSAVLSITIEGPGDADEQEVIDTFTEATTTFMATRINRILAAEPRGYRFDQRNAGRTGILSGQASDGTAMFFMSGNTVTASGMHVWTEASLSRYDFALSDDRDSAGSFAMISAGADFLLSPTVAVGAMVQFDHLSETSDDLFDISGTGWMAGPYVSGQLTEDLFFNVKLGFGASRNDARLEVFGDGVPYEGSFRTKRTQLRGAIYGNHALKSGVTLSPEVSLAFMRERQEDYRVSNGVTDIDVPGATVDFGQLGIAVMAEMPIGSGPYIAFAEPTLDWTFAGSQIARDDPLTGSLALGVRTGAVIGWDGSVAIRFDGIGSDRLSGQTLELRLNYAF